MRGWPELLTELERIDFELARMEDLDAAAPWMERRAAVMREIGAQAVDRAGRPELVRLANALARGEELDAIWRKRKAAMRSEAENLYAAQLLLKAVAPERRGQHFSFES